MGRVEWLAARLQEGYRIGEAAVMLTCHSSRPGSARAQPRRAARRLYPLSGLIDRYHPARGESGIPPLLTNPWAFLQATWRHAVFGVVLGRLA